MEFPINPSKKMLITPTGAPIFPDDWGLAKLEIDEDGNVTDVEIDEKYRQRMAALRDSYIKANITQHYLYAHMPLSCRGRQCPYGGCSYYESGVIEIGDKCIPEIAFILSQYEKLQKALGISGGDPSMYIDEIMLSTLVYNYLLLRRVHAYLQKTDIVVGQPAFASERGIHYTDEQNKALEIRDKIINQINKILSEFNATRKAKDKIVFNEDEFFSALEQHSSTITIENKDEGE